MVNLILGFVFDDIYIGLDEDRDGVLVDDTLNEPTIGDKLESLDLLNGEKVISEESNRASAPGDDKPPTAASVNVLLRQALHADDRALLLDCFYNRDEQVSDSFCLFLYNFVCLLVSS